MVKSKKQTWEKCCIKTTIFNTLTKKQELWLKMHDIQVKLGVKKISDLIRKEICGIFNSNDPTEEQIWDHKALA